MHSGAEDAIREHASNNHDDVTSNTQATSHLLQEKSLGLSEQSQPQETTAVHDDIDENAPPFKRRRLTESDLSRAQRGPSPPWKKAEVDGPSTFVEGGVRKSARTNYVPLDLQPQSDKRKTRQDRQQHKSPIVKSKYGRTASQTIASAKTPTTGKNHAAPNGLERVQSNGGSKDDSPRRPVGRPKKVVLDKTAELSMSEPKPKRPYNKSSSLPQSRATLQTSGPDTPLKRPVGRPKSTNKFLHISPHSHALMMESTAKHHSNGTLPKEDSQVIAGKKLRLSHRFNPLTMTVQHPEHIVRRAEILDGDERKAKFSSLGDWLEKEGRLGFDGEADPHITEAEAHNEALLRYRISEAARPGGVLDKDTCEYWQPETYQPPMRLYAHHDRLVAHAKRFQFLLNQERGKHLRNAKECAQQAAAYVQHREERNFREWKKEQPKTAEELAQEQRMLFRATYAQLCLDMKQKWQMIGLIVDDTRMQRWQAEQERLGKEALNKAIETSKGLLSRRKRRHTSGSVSGAEGRSANSSSEDGETSNTGSSDESEEENMSSSQSDTSEEDIAIDDDAGLTQIELRQKYAKLPDTHADATATPLINMRATQSQADDQTTQRDSPQPAIALEDVDVTMLDDSDESTDMDDETSNNDESDSMADDSSDDQTDGDDAFGKLGGFLTKRERDDLAKAQSEAEAQTSDIDQINDSDEEADKVSLIPDVVQGPTPSASQSEEPPSQPRMRSPPPSIRPNASNHKKLPIGEEEGSLVDDEEEKPLDEQIVRSDLIMEENELPATPTSTQALKTSVPSLLRGTLREYQHYGLDWLAGLYANGTNGILADEMGLGKTIQTIALLAHLAVHHEAWGPHLVVVPTSVMLNWEMEFKKFLPGFKVLAYYGSQEERKRKRAGWMDDDKWNVWITSYTLITQDQQVFKRKAWHYMILDEAHNIKNFQSQRWQTLLTFKTRARLLLTGTPLQNNLTELWSLLYFLMPSDDAGNGVLGFTNLEDFTGWFKKPTEQILEQGREKLDAEARVAVTKLHDILRPYLLRRLKADVEKQMPGKYEHVVYCRLSKRQRYLYDGFMSRAQTRETLASGNTFSIMNALMQLRKVCNHPDLFETRQIVTSFAMPKSAVANFEIKELLVRRRLLQEKDPHSTLDLNLVNLLPGGNEEMSALDTIQPQRLGALAVIRHLASQQRIRVSENFKFSGTSVGHALRYSLNTARQNRYARLCSDSYVTSLRSQRRPLYSRGLMDQLRFVRTLPNSAAPPPHHRLKSTRPMSSLTSSDSKDRYRILNWHTNTSAMMSSMVLDLAQRSEAMHTTVDKFACVTPAVTAGDLVPISLGATGIQTVEQAKQIMPYDPFHEARMRLSIAFPDKRLLQYDCGKLQKLASLLRDLQSGGHRALIFTQMTKVLDILEQFLNIHGYRYLRLDGATKIEERQILTERFNNDNRILVFILSSRSGGIGINLTGADSVIFYDLDWNPAMDKQCQDRAHRIGQTRDVHIYRLVSEHTIEANILRKANQKRMLDDVVIQDGEFTTEYFNNMSVKDIVGNEAVNDADAAANAAMDRVLDGRHTGRVLDAVEDKEDVLATKEAEKEIIEDAQDFNERGAVAAESHASKLLTSDPMPKSDSQKYQGDVETTTTLDAASSGLALSSTIAVEIDEPELPSCDEYMIRFMEWELQDVPIQPPLVKSKSKKKKGKESLVRKR